jgi:hypothetical protein
VYFLLWGCDQVHLIPLIPHRSRPGGQLNTREEQGVFQQSLSEARAELGLEFMSQTLASSPWAISRHQQLLTQPAQLGHLDSANAWKLLFWPGLFPLLFSATFLVLPPFCQGKKQIVVGFLGENTYKPQKDYTSAPGLQL